MKKQKSKNAVDALRTEKQSLQNKLNKNGVLLESDLNSFRIPAAKEKNMTYGWVWKQGAEKGWHQVQEEGDVLWARGT